jgi:hypothetical protein
MGIKALTDCTSFEYDNTQWFPVPTFIEIEQEIPFENEPSLLVRSIHFATF